MKKTKATEEPEEKLPLLRAIHPVTKREIDVDYARDVSIVATDIRVEARRLSRKVAWYTALHDELKDAVKRAKYEEDCISEDLFIELSKEADPKTMKVTEIKTYVSANPRMRAAVRARMEAESLADRVKGVVAALDVKRYMIVTIGKVDASEMGSGLSDA